MDDRRVKEVLSRAAGQIVPSRDLGARAERRYRLRRARRRGVTAVMVALLVASGIVAALLIGRGSPSVVGPTPTSSSHASTTTMTSATTTTVASGGLNVHGGTALSFVDAHLGFAVETQTGHVARTDDGGRTWRQVGVLEEAESSIHFENASDGVAWGNGPLELTVDGGAHWRDAGGPVDNLLAWAEGRLWGMSPCVQTTPCGSRPLLISDDSGRSWQRTAALRQGFGAATVVAVSRSRAYVVEPSTDTQPGATQLAITSDGGATWQYRSAPCTGSETYRLYLAATQDALLLICGDQPGSSVRQQFRIYTSSNGRTWQSQPPLPGNGNVQAIVHTGSRWLLAMLDGNLWSSSNAHTWQPAITIEESEGASWSLDERPGIGAWAVLANTSAQAGLWFSTDGAHWQHLAGA